MPVCQVFVLFASDEPHISVYGQWDRYPRSIERRPISC